MKPWVLVLGCSTGHGGETCRKLAKKGYGIIGFHFDRGEIKVQAEKLLNELKDSMSEDIKFWLPYINMRDIVVTKDEDRHIVNFSFTFSVGESNANQIIILEVSEQGGLSIV